MKITEINKFFNETLGKNIYRVGDTIYWQFAPGFNEIEYKILAIEGNFWILQTIKNVSANIDRITYYDNHIDRYHNSVFLVDNCTSKIPRVVK